MRSGMCAVDGIAIGWFLYGRDLKKKKKKDTYMKYM